MNVLNKIVSLATGLFQQRTSQKKQVRARRRGIGFEPLESRLMLTAAPDFNALDYAMDVPPGMLTSGVFSAPIGQVSATDEDSTDLTYSILGSALFDIDSVEGLVYAHNSVQPGTSYNFNIQVEDESGNTDAVPVEVEVPDISAHASDDEISTVSLQPIESNLLGNDTLNNPDAAFDYSSIDISYYPTHGTVTVNVCTGAVTYISFPGFVGSDEFAYTFTDTEGTMSNVAAVVVTVDSGDPPIAMDDSVTANDGQPLDIDVTANDYVAMYSDLDLASLQIVSTPSHGQIVIDSATGIVTYTADAFYVGADSFAYTVSDANGLTSAPATVSIDVQSNRVPEITKFTAKWEYVSDKWKLSGQVQDEDVSTVVVEFGGVLQGDHSVAVEADGTFEYFVNSSDFSFSGDVSATAIDTTNGQSITKYAWVELI